MTDAVNVRGLFLPHGIYFVFSPYQELHGVVATLPGAVQKPGNIDAAHLGLQPIHYALQEEELGNSVCMAVFWFGDGYPYNGVLLGPVICPFKECGLKGHKLATSKKCTLNPDYVLPPVSYLCFCIL